MGTPPNTQAATTPTKKTSRFRRPRSSKRPKMPFASTNAAMTAATTASAFQAAAFSPLRTKRSTEKTAISTMPAGSAAARQMLEISSAGVVMKRSSAAHSHAGQATKARKASVAQVPMASNRARRAGDRRESRAVMRMCSARRSAITAPSMASQMKSMEASSSAQTSGWWKTKRATTPANSTPISASTSRPAAQATAAPIQRSMRSHAVQASCGVWAGLSWGAVMPAPRRCARGWPRPGHRACASIRRRSRPCATAHGRRRCRQC